VGWVLARGFDAYTLERVVTVLVVACPHALGLAIPLVIAISTTLSARSGILVRDRLALEHCKYNVLSRPCKLYAVVKVLCA
jgi:P-type Cu2+ transporter